MLPILHRYSVSSLYRQPTESMRGFLSKRWSFWLALFSCIAFLVGNMVGQHGWHAFWQSVWGQETEIVFTGAVPPIPHIPDPERWGGGNHNYDFTDVPDELLISMPSYRPKRGCEEDSHDRRVLSVDYNGDYDSGGMNCGSHPAADILAPKGTPVVATMNGIVDRVEERGWGFGNTVVIRHPNVPTPENPDTDTTLYSSYAHLGKMFVTKGETVHKGQQIALTGQTGFATAPHLHFQIDKEAPFHPYWPFTTAEATEQGMSFMDAVNEGLGRSKAETYTINPLSYVEEYRDWDSQMILVENESDDTEVVEVVELVKIEEKSFLDKLRENVNARLAQRIKYKSQVVVVKEDNESVEDNENSDEPESPVLSVPIAPPSSVVSTDIPMPLVIEDVTEITILHDGAFERDWEEIVLYARDKDGNFIKDVHFEGKIYLETSFGSADFAPSALTEEQFDDRGRAFVKMLPRGVKTVIPAVRGAFTADGDPMLSTRTVSARTQRQG